MKNSLFLLLLLGICFGCSPKEQTQQETNRTVEIPEFLQRPSVIGPADEMGNLLDLYAELKASIEAQPEQLEKRLTLAELFMQEARISGEHGHYFPAALTVIDAVLTEEPEEAIRYRAMLDKASVLLSLHQFAEAKKVGEAAVKLNPYDAGIYGVLVDANVELGNYEEAVAMSDKMISIRPDLRSYSRVSYLREIYGQPQGSIEAMKMAATAGYPGMEQTEWARLVLGGLYQSYGQLDSAALQYEIALANRPNFPFAVAALSEVEGLKGNTEKSKELLEKACALIPEVGFYINLATMEKEAGNEARAKELTNEILAMLADDEASGHMMSLEYSAVYLELLNNPEKALTYALKEYEIRPRNIDVNQQLATVYYHLNDLEKAEAHLKKAMRTNRKSAELLCLSGLLDQNNGGTAGTGATSIKAAFELNPNLDCSYCEEAKKLL